MRPLPLLLLLLTLASCDFLGGGDDETLPEDDGTLPGRIVFSATQMDQEGNRVDDGNIYVMDADGSNLRQLTFLGDTAFAANPAWSPDGQTIAFATSLNSTTLGPSLYLMDADGPNLRPFKVYPWESPRVIIGWDPAWSPDGKRIASSWCWNCEVGGRNAEISVVEVAGGDYREEDVVRLTDHSGPDWGPAWSPDGRWIAFASGRDYPDAYNYDLYIVGADGSDLRRLTTTGKMGGFLWDLSSGRIAVQVDKALFLLDPEDGNMQPLQADLPRGYDLFLPMGLAAARQDVAGRPPVECFEQR